MGSFKNLDKAKARVEALSDAGFSVFINEVERTGEEKLYRVLYSEKFTKKENAKYRRNELLALSKIQELKLQDIWCCESNGIKYTEVTETPVVAPTAPVTETPVVQQVQVPAEPQKQTVIVKINNIEEQRFDITSDDRLIRVNINVDENATTTAAVNPSTQEKEEETAPAMEIITAEQAAEAEPVVTEESESMGTEETEEVPAEPFEEDADEEELVDEEAEDETEDSAETEEVVVEEESEEIIPEPFVEEAEEIEEIPAEPYVEDEEEDFEYNEK